MSYCRNVKNFKKEMKNSKSKTLIEKGLLSRKRYSKKHKNKQKAVERGYETSRSNLDKINSDLSFGHTSNSLNADKGSNENTDIILEEEINNLDPNTLRVMKKLGFDVDQVLKRKNGIKAVNTGKNENCDFKKKNRLSYQTVKSKGRGHRGSLKKGYAKRHKKSFKDQKKKYLTGKFQDSELSMGKNCSNFSFKENSAIKANRNKYWRSVTPKPLKSKGGGKLGLDKNKGKARLSSREKEPYSRMFSDKSRGFSKPHKKITQKKKKLLNDTSLFLKKSRMEANNFGKRSNSRAKNKLRDILKKNTGKTKKRKSKVSDKSNEANSLLDTFNKDCNKTQEWKESLRVNASDTSTIFSPSGTKSKKDRSRSKSKSRSRSKKKIFDSSYSNLHSLKTDLLKKNLRSNLNRTPTPNKNKSKSKKIIW